VAPSPGRKITQDALAKRYDLSQGEISNSIRLLKLPEAAQKLVISREITATEARDVLVPWADMPELIEEACRHAARGDLNYQINQRAQKRARSMNDANYCDKPRLFKPTPEQRKELRIRQIWGTQYAFNTELYDRLQAEAAAKLSQRKEKREAAGETADERETPAERRAKAKAQAEIFAKRLYRWKIAWLQRLVAERIERAEERLILRLLLHFTVADGHAQDRAESLQRAIKAHGGKAKGRGWPSLRGLSLDQPWKVARAAVLGWMQESFEGWRCNISPEQIEDVAGELAIKVKDEWKLTREFLELHNRAQLEKLIEEWNHAGLIGRARGVAKRGELIDVIMDFPDGVKCPRELLELKSVRLV
jgi:hypothetical protein